MKKIKLDGSWKFSQNSDKDGLKGIFTKNCGELPCQTKTIIAVNINDEVVAQVSYEVTGDKYRYAQRDFGDQLEKAIGTRRGY